MRRRRIPPSLPVPRSARHVSEHWRAPAAVRGSGQWFVPALTEGLPLAARRWIAHAVAENTPLTRSVRLEMSGRIRLGSWRPFTAVQLLVPATGSSGLRPPRLGLCRCPGYDRLTAGSGEMRWRAGGILPYPLPADVMSAPARPVAWLARASSYLLPSPSRSGPATRTLPRPRGQWLATRTPCIWTSPTPERCAGCGMHRWGNPEGREFARYPFTVTVEAERTFGGMTIASRIRAGWNTGNGPDSDFFHADITDVCFC